MTIVSDAISDFESLLEYGEQVEIKYYTQVSSGEYDDDVMLMQSGTSLWASGVIQPINNNQYSSDALLLQQGKILSDDKKLYIKGNILTSGLAPIKFGINGSPTTEQYQISEEGKVTDFNINGTTIYKKVYLKYLPDGKFIGE